jgi:hypothetical protein
LLHLKSVNSRLCPRPDAELREYVTNVHFDRRLFKNERFSDLSVRLAKRDESQDVLFPHRQFFRAE